ncbi:MAG: CHAT domain-containing protein [Spirulinaceae cyanobacterium SM2_1_0]|nr:CHAT domain-containing protein [Spirulinaceae cyanobacterium SM2_1_0]
MAQVTGTQPAIIYVFVRQEQLELVLISTTGSPIRFSVPDAPAEQVLARVRELQAEIVDPTRRQTTSYRPAAQQLDAWIMQPLRADLRRLGVDTLMFSLDEGLRSLPLAALHDGEQFLIERYRFSIIPSLSLLNLNYVDVRDANILAMGISEFQHLSPLPAVPVELAAIKEQFTRGEVILNEGFTLANLKQQRQAVRAKVLHLATHAEFVPGDDGFIEFWERSVSLQQLATLDWHDPELALLVLSACRTALGDVEAEYGFAGLATSSGVDTAIASLWYASDVGTLGLMSEFYIHLRHLPLKSEALRQAQLSLLRGELQLAAGQIEAESGVLPLPPELTTLGDRHFQHPYYWSGFVTIGNPW